MKVSQELLLKTAFCCMACDGDIAADEIDLLKEFAEKDDSWKGFDIQTAVNKGIVEINERGVAYLGDYLKEVANADLDDEDSLKLIDIAIRMIEADKKVEYSEVKFFKKIREMLKVSDEKLFQTFPDKEDYFLPDISAPKEFDWTASFETIQF